MDEERPLNVGKNNNFDEFKDNNQTDKKDEE